MIRITLLSLALLFGCSTESSAGEEPATVASAGDEHAGDEAEHAGDKAEHAGDKAEHAGDHAKHVTAEDIKAAMKAHIEAKIAEGDGVFVIDDPETDETLRLEFVEIHDPVRKIEGKGYFACTDFHPEGGPEGKLYDLDFWLDKQDGELAVTKTKIHKHPKKKKGEWVKKARYTFVDDEPVVIE